MIRKLALAVVPLILLAAACGDGDNADDGVEQDTPQATVEATAEATATESAAETDSGAGEALFGALNPFNLLGGLGSASGLEGLSEDTDPSLKGPLLVAGDLPADYTSLGEFSFSLPTELGTVEMVASQFGTGDMSSAEMGSIVMSAVMALPPEAMAEMGDLSELEDLTEEDLAELQGLEELGIGLQNLRLLDASGLGDGGAGFHMEMNLGAFMDALVSGLGEEFGGIDAEIPQEEMPIPDSIGFDAYMFLRGERMLMVMVMWPTGEETGVDARDLAETMDGRA